MTKMTISQHQNQIKSLRQLLSGKRNASSASIVREITGLIAYSGSAYPSQEYLGLKAGIHRETANRRINKLNGLFFHKNYRHMQTCTYYPTSWFLNNRHHFYDLIPALRQISLLLLFSITSNVYSQNVTQYKEYYRKTDKRSAAWVMKRVQNAPLEFYEPRDYTYQSQTTVFLKNKQQNQPHVVIQPLKERVMNQNSVINLIADAYGLSRQQEEMLSNYSEEALQYAVKEFNRQKQTVTINSPVNWIGKVAAAYKQNAPRFPKNGKEVGHSSTARNPHGHSPASQAPKMTNDERIAFLVNEITSFKDKIANPQKYFHPKVDIESTLVIGRALLKANEDELALLQRGGTSNIPVDSNNFLDNYEEASNYSEGPDYEEHLNEISKDKSDPEGYKLVVRRRDYRNTARK